MRKPNSGRSASARMSKMPGVHAVTRRMSETERGERLAAIRQEILEREDAVICLARLDFLNMTEEAFEALQVLIRYLAKRKWTLTAERDRIEKEIAAPPAESAAMSENIIGTSTPEVLADQPDPTEKSPVRERGQEQSTLIPGKSHE